MPANITVAFAIVQVPDAAPSVSVVAAPKALTVVLVVLYTVAVVPVRTPIVFADKTPVACIVLDAVIVVNAPVLGVPLPIVPGAAHVAPSRKLAFRFDTTVVLATVNGAVPVATVLVMTPENAPVVAASAASVVAPVTPKVDANADAPVTASVPVSVVFPPTASAPVTVHDGTVSGPA